MDYGWFMQEVHERVKFCDFPPLVTTASDGDNGGWFRNTSANGNFWGVLYQPLLEWVRRGKTEICPVMIDDYLNRFGTWGEVRVRSGAWNTGWHNGHEFTQWTGSQAQRDALRRVAETSQAFHALRQKVKDRGAGNPEADLHLLEVQRRLLQAETSCNFFWGDAWLPRCHRDLDAAWGSLEAAKRITGAP